MQTMLEKKVFLINTLSADSSFILQYAQQDKIITQREYRNLKHSNHTEEKIVTNLLDTVMNKGDRVCHKFVALLKQNEIQENYPDLPQHFIILPRAHNQDNPVKAGDEIDVYRMSSMPRGYCLIINNVIFDPPHKTRYGSDADEESVKDVFQWLGFQLEVYKNQTAEQMKNLLKAFNQKPLHSDGDCFVCVILSHGSADGVYGTDGISVSREDIFGPFTGKSCPSLGGKPKVFFIQACRGKEYHLPIQVQADNYEEEEMETSDDNTVDMDAIQIISIPEDSDFLIASSTIEGYVSFRDTINGTWFIQSLCKQLKKYCPKGEDVPSILLCVNKEVSENAARVRNVGQVKQMPVHKVTLRKKLMFRVPNQQEKHL